MYIVKDVMSKKANEERPRMRLKAHEANKYRYTRYYTNETEWYEIKDKSDLGFY